MSYIDRVDKEFVENFICAIELLDDVKDHISEKTIDRLSTNS